VVPTQSLTGPGERRDVTLKTGAPVHNGTPNMTEEPTQPDQKPNQIGTKKIIQSTDTQTSTEADPGPIVEPGRTPRFRETCACCCVFKDRRALRTRCSNAGGAHQTDVRCGLETLARTPDAWDPRLRCPAQRRAAFPAARERYSFSEPMRRDPGSFGSRDAAGHSRHGPKPCLQATSAVAKTFSPPVPRLVDRAVVPRSCAPASRLPTDARPTCALHAVALSASPPPEPAPARSARP
jgi:hypothetical protein